MNMVLEDIIPLSSDNASDTDNDTNNLNSEPAENDIQPDASTDKEYCKRSSEIHEGEDKNAVMRESAVEIERSTMVYNTSNVHTSPDRENSPVTSIGTCLDNNTGERPISGIKRVRITCIDNQPTVHVVYTSLTRESKRMLNALLQQWSEWQGQHESSSNDSSKEKLECGEETYFAALCVGEEKPSGLTFWVDNQARKEENMDCTRYDRAFFLGSSSSTDASYYSERFERSEASRCFNCASYSHSLRECPKARDNAAISTARNLHTAKKSHNNSANGQSRYFLNSSGKFDDLKAGVLRSETRECLGIGELDPPPWLQRMREIGYPLGYLDVETEEDSPSGIVIYAEDEDETKMEIYEEGEVPERQEAVAPEKKMSVEFPGINAPIPENADPKQWGVTPQSSSSERWRSRCINSTGNAADYDYREESYSRLQGGNSDYIFSSRHYSYSPRYGPYDRYPSRPRSPKPSLERWEPIPYYAPSPDSSSSHGRDRERERYLDREGDRQRDGDRQREREGFDRYYQHRRW